MEIKIDTHKESKEELKQIIKLLQNLVGEPQNEEIKEKPRDYFSNQETEPQRRYEPTNTNNETRYTSNETTREREAPSEDLFNIFNSSKEPKKEEEDTYEKRPEREKRNIIPY